MKKEQIVIVGAGPTGLLAANLLGKAGIATLVLEQLTGLNNEPRAITIDDEGLRICQAVGLADVICQQLQLNVGAYYVSKKRFLAQVAPQHHPNGYPLISTFYQPDFEAALLQGLERFPHVEIRFGHTVESLAQEKDGVTLTVSAHDGSQQHIHCAYVLACDGGKSRLRQALDIMLRPPQIRDLFSAPTTDKSQQVKPRKRQEHNTQRWLVIDYNDPSQQSDHITFYCNPARPAVSVQAPRMYRRWEFMLKPGEQEKDFLDDKAIARMIQQAEATLPESSQTATHGSVQIKRKVVYRFYATIATAFSHGRVFLLGDAAHLMPPFGGQGMNSGLRDAYNLCWKLKLVVDEQAPASLLASYQQERYPHVAQMILFSSLLGRIIMPTNLLQAWIRDIFFRSINKIPLIRTQLTEMRVKPQPRYTEGCLLPTKQTKLVGRQLPQPYVLQNGVRTLFDNVLGDGFVLLRLYENPAEAFTPLQNEGLASIRGMLSQMPIINTAHPHSDPRKGRGSLSTRSDNPLWLSWLAHHEKPTDENMNHDNHKGLSLRGIDTLNINKAIRFVCIQPQSATMNGEPYGENDVIKDCDGVLEEFLGKRDDLFVLVRPDRYIMAAFRIEQAREIRTTAHNSLITEAT